MTALVFRYEAADLSEHPNRNAPQPCDVAKIDGHTHIFWRGEWRRNLGAAFMSDDPIAVHDPYKDTPRQEPTTFDQQEATDGPRETP